MNELIEVPWVEAGSRMPSNANHAYHGQPDTPFIPCLVWACHPGIIRGGVMEIVRWDSKNNCWMKSDMTRWTLQPPYIITHFFECDSMVKPKDI